MSLLFIESPILGTASVAGIALAENYEVHTSVRYGLWIVLIFLLIFYRYTPHTKRYPDRAIVSPAEGLISRVKITPTHAYISIFLSPINRHTQIYPANGTIVKRIYDATGKFKIAYNDDKCRDNEKMIHFLKLNHNDQILKVTQIAGFMVRCISSETQTPKKVKAGEYLGIIKFGSRVDILFPISSHTTIYAKEGQRVCIGSYLAILG